MGDRTRLFITGVVAIGAVGASLGGHGIWRLIEDGRRPAASAPGPALASLHDFDGVDSTGPDNVVITQGAGFSVRTEGDPAVLKRLNIYVDDEILHVDRLRPDDGFASGKPAATVHVTMPVLRRVAVKGSGDLSADRLSGSSVGAFVSGSGSLKVDEISAGDARLTLLGSGALTVGGTTRALQVNATGSGTLHAEDLKAARTTVKLVGSGNVYARASERAEVTQLGSGNAHVVGTRNCQIAKTGSGDAECTS